jgi:hypothetical protein
MQYSTVQHTIGHDSRYTQPASQPATINYLMTKWLIDTEMLTINDNLLSRSKRTGYWTSISIVQYRSVCDSALATVSPLPTFIQQKAATIYQSVQYTLDYMQPCSLDTNNDHQPALVSQPSAENRRFTPLPEMSIQKDNVHKDCMHAADSYCLYRQLID